MSGPHNQATASPFARRTPHAATTIKQHDNNNDSQRPLSVYDNLTTTTPSSATPSYSSLYNNHHRPIPPPLSFTFDTDQPQQHRDARRRITTTDIDDAHDNNDGSDDGAIVSTSSRNNNNMNGSNGNAASQTPQRHQKQQRPQTTTTTTRRRSPDNDGGDDDNDDRHHDGHDDDDDHRRDDADVVASPSFASSAAHSTPTAQYENVVETIKLRNSFRQQQQQQQQQHHQPHIKPVISDAKSSFFGLSAAPKTAANSSEAASTPAPPQPPQLVAPAATAAAAAAAVPIYAMPHHHNNSRPTPPTVVHHHQPPGGDRSPLIENNQQTPVAQPLMASKSNGEYQNIPSNSAMFQQQQQQQQHQPPRHGQRQFSGGDSSSPDEDVEAGGAYGQAASPRNGMHLTNGDADSTGGAAATGGGKHFMSEANRRISEQHTPSQAVYMATTVPQNIKGSNIAGRHTPTRTSLRHSRMIVVNKNYQAPRRPNPLNLTYPLLAKLLLIVQLICGILICSLAVWVLLWAPNTRTRDNPYWSGIMLCVAAVLALILIEFRRIPRQKMREHCYTFLRLNSTTLSMLATVAAFGAFVFATLHLDNVTSAQTVCMPGDVFSSSNAVCICLFGSAANATAVASVRPLAEGGLTAGGSEFEYRDLSCTEVRGAWKYILFAFTLLNMIAFIVSAMYLMMLCCPRRGHKRPRRPSETRGGLGVGGGGAGASSAAYAPVRSAL